MKAKPMDNVEFVTWLMNYSSYGGLAQAFIINAIDHHCKEVIADQAHLREAMKNGMINPEAWIGIAKELQKKIAERPL